MNKKGFGYGPVEGFTYITIYASNRFVKTYCVKVRKGDTR